MVYAYFNGSTSPHCAGICDKYILKDPLRGAAETLRDVRDIYARSQLTGTPVFNQTPPAGTIPLPAVLSLELQGAIPDANTSFLWQLSGDEISAWENVIQQFRRPTVRYSQKSTVTGFESTGFSHQWTAEIRPTYLYDSENWTAATAPRRRYLLEAIYNAVNYYTGDWSQFNGSIITQWNTNRANEWNTYFHSPNHQGVTWTDRDGVVHQPDDTLADSLLDKSSGSTQAVLEFLVDEQLVVSDSGGNVVREKNVFKYVFEPVAATWDANANYWVPDKAAMLAAAWDALAKAGAETNKLADVTPPAGGSGGATTSVFLCAIHGIFTLDDGLVIS
jgi:hypothetical protein